MQLLWRNAGKGGTQASIEYLTGGTLRVTLHMVRPFTVEASRHIWLYIPSVGYWMSHPFAIAWDNTTFDSVVNQPRARVAPKVELDHNGEKVAPQTVTLLIRCRRGFTAKLCRKVLAASGKLLVNAWVEGPYVSK
jgi:hypothetical protein